MPKLKTNKGAAKRFKITKGGNIKKKRAFKSHKLTKKSAKRKRKLRKPVYIESNEKQKIKTMLPYL
ncbi:MAG: 50S ribosomal protein L35 [Spirochaetota bacterium]